MKQFVNENYTPNFYAVLALGFGGAVSVYRGTDLSDAMVAFHAQQFAYMAAQYKPKLDEPTQYTVWTERK